MSRIAAARRGKSRFLRQPRHGWGREPYVQSHRLRPSHWSMVAVASAALLAAACGAGAAESGPVGDPGSGGGAGPGGPGVPLGFTSEFSVRNDAPFARTETLLASVPLPYGHHSSTAQLGVSGHETAWRVLQRWQDGSIRMAQAQFTDTLAVGETKTYQVVGGMTPLTGSFQQNAWVAAQQPTLQLGAEVKDTFNVSYRAFVGGQGETLAQTPLCRTQRHRVYHVASSGGIGRDYLTSTFYVTEFRDAPVLVVDWVLGNDYLGSDNPQGSTDRNLYPLGGVDVNEARFLVGGAGVSAYPYRAVENGIAAGASAGSGLWGFRVMQNDWIDDAQTRRYRFVLPVIHPAAAQVDRDRWTQAAQAMVASPCLPLPTQPSAYATGALGLLGGPIAGPADAWARADSEYFSFLGGSWFGTWGSRGDPLATGTTGTPRNHPLSPELAHAVQAQHHRLLLALEQRAWIQAARPYHLYGLVCADHGGLFLWDGVPIYPGSRDLSYESLGRRALYGNDPYSAYRTRRQTGGGRAHGFEHYDHEHWSTDLLFDYWSLTGDCWAQEELRQLGQSLKSLMRLSVFGTQWIQAVRAEGWIMQGFVQCYLATGDVGLRDYALQRVHNIVDTQRRRDHGSKAMAFQGNYPGTTWPMNHEFYMPWQHGAVLFGYLGAYRHFADPLLLTICEDVAQCVDYAWVRNWQDPTFGFVANGLRYYVATTYNGAPIPANYWDGSHGIRFGDAPLGGAHTFLTTGLFLLADHTSNAQVRTKALNYGGLLRQGALGARRWDKWHYCIPETYAQ